jgi:hypothetical protein
MRDYVLTTLGWLSPSGLYVLASRHLPALLVPTLHPTEGGPPPILNSALVFFTNNGHHKLFCVELQAQRAVPEPPADHNSGQITASPNIGMPHHGFPPPQRWLAPARVPSTSVTAPSLREPSSPLFSPSQISPLQHCSAIPL